MFQELLFKKKRILFSADLLKRMKQYLQIQNETAESGGVLLGFVCKDSLPLLVTEMTVPSTGDTSHRNRFTRQSVEHIKTYNRIYESSNKTCLYIGEWHTHPELLPNCSKIDEDNWKSISMNDCVFPMQIHVIAGIASVRFWAVCKGEDPLLLETLHWTEFDNYRGE